MPERNLRIAFVTSEVSPFAKSGELADVSASLPKFLTALGLEVNLFMPKYRRPEIDSLPKELVASGLSVPLGGEKVKASVYRGELEKSAIYFIDSPKYFLRENIYGISKGPYLDNDERFVFFNRAVLEFLVKAKIRHDVIHCNNWPSALIPVFLKTHYAHRPLFKGTASVLTLHSTAYQGEFPADSLALTGLNWNDFAAHQIAFDGKFNFLKAGVIFSDAVNTVSRTYKKEILSDKHMPGLEEILKRRNMVLHAILNGVDNEEWDPRTDPNIAANFGPADLSGKERCRKDLIKEFGLRLSDKAALIGIVSYFSRHKGFDLIKEAVPELMAMDIGLVVLGRGEEIYEEFFRAIQDKFPERVGIRFEASPVLSHKVIAGSDILLMPSLYEPCGLNQMYAFRYGTVPAVRATGGLKESVVPFKAEVPGGNGFVFEEFTPESLLGCLKEALDYRSRPEIWRKIMKEGFRQDFSWRRAAGKYIKLYKKSLDFRRGESYDD